MKITPAVVFFGAWSLAGNTSFL